LQEQNLLQILFLLSWDGFPKLRWVLRNGLGEVQNCLYFDFFGLGIPLTFPLLSFT
jgi:hypothetical protein